MTLAGAPVIGGGKRGYDMFVATGMMCVLALMIVPVPTLIMDLGIAFSVCLGLVTFLVSIYMSDPLELSVFPSLVLMATLLRLSLNVASTRLILLHGAEGPDAAGNIVRSFGHFVVGGDYAVGIILFLILVVINFVVITKGAGRVAEVSARFTLDAMPGKQMAIDADLSSGLINEEQARSRRARIQEDADFHGAMDGASKFVRGDAIAGLVITAINVVGGVAIGVFQHGLSVAQAAENFTILTVGDGLVSQLPALLMSTAAGIVVTRAAGDSDLGNTLVAQLSRYRKPMYISAISLAALALLPGMPTLLLFGLAGLLVFVTTRISEPEAAPGSAESDEKPSNEGAAEREELESLLPIELLELEIGYELIGLVDPGASGGLLKRISGIRRQFVSDLGIILPPVHVRDNLHLKPSQYRLLLSGNEIGTGEIRPGQYLAMGGHGAGAEIPGEPVREPAFGLPARWISGGDRDAAAALGYTVVDADTVIATHLSELLRRSAHDVLGRRETQELLEVFSRSNPSLVDELIPTKLSLGGLIKVLRRLLQEGISIRDLRTILGTLADHADEVKDSLLQTELVRRRLAKCLTAKVKGPDGAVQALVLDPALESELRGLLRERGSDPAAFDVYAIPRLLGAIEQTVSVLKDVDEVPVLLVAADLRPHLAGFCSRHVGGLSVYSFEEIEASTPVQTRGVVGDQRERDDH